MSSARARAESSPPEAPSAVALVEHSVGAPPNVVAAEQEGSHLLNGSSPWSHTTPGSMMPLQPQMEAGLQPPVGEDDTLLAAGAAGSALACARAVLMTPDATSTTFKTTTAVTPVSSRHVH